MADDRTLIAKDILDVNLTLLLICLLCEPCEPLLEVLTTCLGVTWLTVIVLAKGVSVNYHKIECCLSILGNSS